MLDEYQDFFKLSKAAQCSIYSGVSHRSKQPVLLKRFQREDLSWDELLRGNGLQYSQRDKMFARTVQIFKNKGDFYIVHDRPSGHSLAQTTLTSKMTLNDIYPLIRDLCDYAQELQQVFPNVYLVPQWVFIHRNGLKIVHFEPFFGQKSSNNQHVYLYNTQHQGLRVQQSTKQAHKNNKLQNKYKEQQKRHTLQQGNKASGYNQKANKSQNGYPTQHKHTKNYKDFQKQQQNYSNRAQESRRGIRPRADSSQTTVIPEQHRRNLVFNLGLIAYYLITAEQREQYQSQDQYLQNINTIVQNAEGKVTQATRDKKMGIMVKKMLSMNVFQMPSLDSIVCTLNDKVNQRTPIKKHTGKHLQIEIQKISLQPNKQQSQAIIQDTRYHRHRRMRTCCIQKQASIERINQEFKKYSQHQQITTSKQKYIKTLKEQLASIKKELKLTTSHQLAQSSHYERQKFNKNKEKSELYKKNMEVQINLNKTHREIQKTDIPIASPTKERFLAKKQYLIEKKESLVTKKQSFLPQLKHQQLRNKTDTSIEINKAERQLMSTTNSKPMMFTVKHHKGHL